MSTHRMARSRRQVARIVTRAFVHARRVGARTHSAGVGEKARADARIILEGVKSTISQQRLKESNYVVWQSQVNQGSATESLVLPSFNGPVEPVFKGPVLAQIPAGDFKTQLQSLATQPGMEYLKTLSTRSDVNWQAVELASRQWNYKQQGLTGAGAAIVSAALAWATGGVGASLLGTTGTTTSLMANVAFTSLTSQATIAFINNGGDLGKTLKALGESDVVKATLTAVLTAGALDKINGLSSIKALAGSLRDFASSTDAKRLNMVVGSMVSAANRTVRFGSK